MEVERAAGVASAIDGPEGDDDLRWVAARRRTSMRRPQQQDPFDVLGLEVGALASRPVGRQFGCNAKAKVVIKPG